MSEEQQEEQITKKSELEQIKDYFTTEFGKIRNEWEDREKFLNAKIDAKDKEIAELNEHIDKKDNEIKDYRKLLFQESTSPQYSVPTAQQMYEEQFKIGLSMAFDKMKLPPQTKEEFMKEALKYHLQ